MIGRRQSLLLGLLAVALAACRTSEPEAAAVPLRGGPHFFAKADPSTLVPGLSEPLSYDAAQAAATAFVAYYGEDGHLATLETLAQGKTQQMQRFTYDPAGRLTRRDAIAKDGTLTAEKVGVNGNVRAVTTQVLRRQPTP